jgi:hypothetical protein
MQTDILNPSAVSPLNPDYGWNKGLPTMLGTFQARSGELFSRRLYARGPIYDLQWSGRPSKSARELERWAAQFEQGWFSLWDWDAKRCYSGRFVDALSVSPPGYEKVTIKGQFAVLPGKPMLEYPHFWDRDSKFIYATDDDGNAVANLIGAWASEQLDTAKSAPCYVTEAEGDSAQILYFGFGFRVWSPIGPDSGGSLEIYLDDVLLDTVGLFAQEAVRSAPVFEKSDVALGMHKVRVRGTGVYNPLSTGTKTYFDAIEVMR